MGLLALQMQSWTPWASKVLGEGSWPGIVWINPGGRASPCPNVPVTGRFVQPGGDGEEMAFARQGRAGAESLLERLKPRIEECWWLDAIIFQNEPVVAWAEIPAFVAFQSHMAELLRGFYETRFSRQVKAVLGNWPCTHPGAEPDEAGRVATIKALGPLVKYADILGFHEYAAPTLYADAGWFMYRYRRAMQVWDDNYFLADNPDVGVAITECGIDWGARTTENHNPHKAGWLDAGITEDQYLQQMAWANDRYQEDGRVRFVSFFVSGPNREWERFKVDENLGRKMGQWNAAHPRRSVSIPEPKRKPVPVPDAIPSPPNAVKIDGRLMQVEEFERYVATLNLGPVKWVVIHHTAIPTEANWKQNGGWEHYKGTMAAYYKRIKGWNEGPHLFVSEQGIGLFWDLTKDGKGVSDYNEGARHIEVVGDYTGHLPTGKTLENAVKAAAILLKKAGKGEEALTYHRKLGEGASECPGAEWIAHWAWFVALVRQEIVPSLPSGLPESETTSDPATVVQKAVWWNEEMTREAEREGLQGSALYLLLVSQSRLLIRARKVLTGL